jgi:hypothetical protein
MSRTFNKLSFKISVKFRVHYYTIIYAMTLNIAANIFTVPFANLILGSGAEKEFIISTGKKRHTRA